MANVEVRSKLDPDEIAAAQAVLAAAKVIDGHPTMAPTMAEVNETGLTGEVRRWLLASGPGRRLAGFAQVTRPDADHPWLFEAVVDPHHRVPGDTTGEDLARAAADIVGHAGGGPLQYWVDQPTAAHDRMAASIGLTAGRVLYQMRCPLPVPADRRRPDDAIVTRPFRPGQDEEAWLTVNNRAFAWHPEQGGWDLAAIKAHESESWFDPNGFLLYEESAPERRLAGFCWTKIHRHEDPALGEIYVIAVDPDFGGRRLGRRLTLAGLHHMAQAGITVGMLYVEADNAPAVKVYVDLGFTVHLLHQLYAGDIPAAR